MKKQVFGTAHVPLSPAVRAGDFVYVSGQVPVDAQRQRRRRRHRGADAPGARQRQGGAGARRRHDGRRREDLAILAPDAREFGGFNKVYAQLFSEGAAGAHDGRSRLMIDIKVEIEAIAYARSRRLRELVAQHAHLHGLARDRDQYLLARADRPGELRDGLLCAAPGGIRTRRRCAPRRWWCCAGVPRADGLDRHRGHRGLGGARRPDPTGQAYEGLRDEILDQLEGALPVDARRARPAWRDGGARL